MNAEPSPRHGARSVASFVALALPVIVLAIMGWRQRWIADDGFINVRIVEQIAVGHGPVFNAGERVEAGTSPLWLWLLAGLRLTLGRVVATEWLAVGAGLVLAVFGLLAAELGAARFVGRRSPGAVLIPLGAVPVAALAPFWDFATSGLETGLSLAWLGGSWWTIGAHAAARRRDEHGGPSPLHPWWAPVVLGLGPLIRPELMLFTVAFLAGWLLVSSGGWRHRIGALAVAAGLPAGYQFFRMGYYAATVPNTALTKDAGGSQWARGWEYLRDFETPYHLWVPLVVVLVMGLGVLGLALARHRIDPLAPRHAISRFLPLVAAAATVVYVVRVGGDFMHARMLLPATFGALLPISVVAVSVVPGRRLQGSVRLLAVGGVVAWALVAAFSLRVEEPAVASADRGIVDERAFWIGLSGTPNPVVVEDYRSVPTYFFGAQAGTRQAAGDRVLMIPERLAEVPVRPGGPMTVEGAAIGIMGVAAGPHVDIADHLSLPDPVGSRLDPPSPRGRPGHEKDMPTAYVLARWAAPRADDDSDTQAARAALDCGELAELREATTDPLTIGRFLQNVLSAPRLTSVRVPVDPRQAQTRFCG